MSYRCCVQGCGNTNERFPSKGNFFDGKFTRFPENTEKRSLWNKIIGSNKNVKKFICSEHFTVDDWRAQDIMMNVPLTKRKLKRDAVPSRKLPISTSEVSATVSAAGKEEMDEHTRKRLVAEALAQYEILHAAVNDSNLSNDKPLTRRNFMACVPEVIEVQKAMDEQLRKRLVAEALTEYDKTHSEQSDNDSSDVTCTSRKKECRTIEIKKCSEDAASVDEMEIPVQDFYPIQTRKCGEVTLDVDYQTFVLNCSICSEIFLDLINFSNHIKLQHTSLLEKPMRNPLDTNEEDLINSCIKPTDEMLQEVIFSGHKDLQHSFLADSDNEEKISQSLESLPKIDFKLENQALITQVIYLLKQYPIIWDKTFPLHEVYRKRRAAITALIAPLSKTFPELKFTYNNTSSLLTRLRQMYMKELKRMQDCSLRNEQYITRLWCFDKLKFLGEDLGNFNRLNPQPNIERIQKIATQPPLDFFIPYTAEAELITIEIIEEYEKLPILWNINHLQYRGKLKDYESLHQLQLVLQKKYPKMLLMEQKKLVMLLKQLHQWFTAEETLRLHSLKLNQNFQCNFTRVYAALDFLRGNVAPFQCKFCKSEFNIEYKYVRHIRQKKYKNGACTKVVFNECQYCSKLFSSPGKLVRHLRMHTNERPYVCEKCGKAFRSYTTLFAHRRSHDKIKPFKCKECGRDYYTASMLRTHQKAHLGVRDKICDFCGKTFTNGKALHRHRSEVHLAKLKYDCNNCGKKLKQYKNILRHWKRCGYVLDSLHKEEPTTKLFISGVVSKMGEGEQIGQS